MRAGIVTTGDRTKRFTAVCGPERYRLESHGAGPSWAVMRGVSLKELQELLGHSSLAMTMRYAHLAPERLRSAVTRLEGLTSSKPAAEQINASVNA
jgi:integrase